MPFGLTIDATLGPARLGRMTTPHGVVETPVFMPVGTAATVKAVPQHFLEELGAAIILANNYHLFLRPGHEHVRRMGGLHRFMSWDRALLTDSGGFQVFSLSSLRKLTEVGVEFRSHLDGSKQFLSPEKAIEAEISLGADIVMAFDECTEYPAHRERARQSMELTLRWAERCRRYFDSHKHEVPWGAGEQETGNREQGTGDTSRAQEQLRHAGSSASRPLSPDTLGPPASCPLSPGTLGDTGNREQGTGHGSRAHEQLRHAGSSASCPLSPDTLGSPASCPLSPGTLGDTGNREQGTGDGSRAHEQLRGTGSSASCPLSPDTLGSPGSRPLSPVPSDTQALFGIVQGGMHKDLRRECAERLVEMDLPGYAIGGLSVGEPRDLTAEIVAYTLEFLPKDKPRYLMGVGTPDEIRQYALMGIDMMDCVHPTRAARHGLLFTSEGKVNIKNTRYAADNGPLDPACACLTCRRYSRAYLRHLFATGETLALVLNSVHNLAYFLDIMRGVRAEIAAGAPATERLR